MDKSSIIDITDYLKEKFLSDDLSDSKRELAEYYCKIISFGSAIEPGKKQHVPLQCNNTCGESPCSGWIYVLQEINPPYYINWDCIICGNSGTIKNWQDTLWDYSKFRINTNGKIITINLGRQIPVKLSLEEYLVLSEILIFDKKAEFILYSAELDRGKVIISGTRDDLELFNGFIASEANHEKDNEARRELLYNIFDNIEAAIRK